MTNTDVIIQTRNPDGSIDFEAVSDIEDEYFDDLITNSYHHFKIVDYKDDLSDLCNWNVAED